MARQKGTKNATITDIKKVHLVSYEVKAVIPTGMYANIQPCIVVEAETLEHAERVVMPHIEMLFAKYREGSVPLTVRAVATPKPAEPVNVVLAKNVGKEDIKEGDLVAAVPEVKQADQSTVQAAPTAPVAPVVPPAPAIEMTVPFSRAKSALESCMSTEALDLVAAQIDKSEKLIESEKVELRGMVVTKRAALTKPQE